MTTLKARDAAHAAVGPFLREVAARIRTAATSARADVDIDDLEATITAVFDAYKPGTASSGLASVRAIVADYTARARVGVEHGYLNDVTANVFVFRLDSAQVDFDAALVEFTAQDALDAANAALAELIVEREAKIAELEDAVNAADLALVMALRPVVEVDLPGRIGDAHQVVLDLQVQRADAERAIPAQRRTAATVALEHATKAVAAAQEALDAATLAAVAAAGEQQRADKAAALVEARYQQAITTRDDHKHRHALEQRDRLRVLAGLPTIAREPEPAADNGDDEDRMVVLDPRVPNPNIDASQRAELAGIFT
jgi:hypothetical protein